MADHDSMNASEAAGKMLASAHADVLREAVRLMLIEIMEGEVAGLAGGERYERSAERVAQRSSLACGGPRRRIIPEPVRRRR